MRKNHPAAIVLCVAALASSSGARASEVPSDEIARKYADLKGVELHSTLSDIADISLLSRNSGDVVWGRIAGFPYDTMTADYIKTRFVRAGLDEVWQESFVTAQNTPDMEWSEVSLTLVGGSSPAAPGRDYVFSSVMPTISRMVTSPEGIEAPIVDVGDGGAQDLSGLDLEGKIVLIHSRTRYAIYRHPALDAIARIADEGKALGLVCVIHRMIPSNDKVFVTNGRGARTLPQVNIGDGDGAFLADVIARSPAENPPLVRLVITGERRENLPTKNTYGLIRGSSDEFVILQAHTDGYFESAGDNGSGLALLVGLARHYSAQPPGSLRRNILFIATSGHHSGPAIGAWNVVKNHQKILAKTLLVIDLEHVGAAGPLLDPKMFAETPYSIQDSHGHPFVLQAIREAADIFGIPVDFDGIEYQYNADIYPYAVVGRTGVPALILNQPLYHYHTIRDDRETVPPHTLEKIARAHAYLLDRIDAASTSDVRTAWRETERDPAELLARGGANPLDLDLAALKAVDLLQ